MAEETTLALTEKKVPDKKPVSPTIKKPPNLIYGLDDSPPMLVNIFLAVQHMCFLFLAIAFPVLIIQQLGNSITAAEAQSFVSLTMISGGLATLIQAYKIGHVGSGYFCPSVSGPAYFDASRIAAAAGGLPLIFGMTLLAGVIETLFSRVVHKLRFLFPAEVTGLIVAMVGVVVIPLGIKSFFGITPEHPALSEPETMVGITTFVIMVSLNIWSKGNLKLFCALIGVICGYIFAVFIDLIPDSDFKRITDASYFALPQLSHIRWSFDFTLVIPFIVATISSSLKTVGDLVTCQKINDADWKRPDMKNISDGVLADGLGGVIPGVIGAYGQSTSSSNIGMSIATGSTSRKIAIPLSIIFFILAFFPKLAEVFIIMPRPVMGAALIFSVAFMITTGFQMMMSRMLDPRKIFIIGFSLIFGLSVDMVPGIYQGLHPWIKPVFASSLSLATITAIVLNVLFRIGISKKETFIIRKGENISERIFDLMEKQGGAWAARKDVFTKATSVVTEVSEFLLLSDLTDGILKITLIFEEFNFNIIVEYNGKPIIIPHQRPTETEILEEDGAAKLSLFIISRYSDKIKTETRGSINLIHLHFEH